MKIVVELYPPFRPVGEKSTLEIELHEGAKLYDLLETLSQRVIGFHRHLPQNKENYILWGSVVPIQNGRVIGYDDTLEEGTNLKLYSAFCGG